MKSIITYIFVLISIFLISCNQNSVKNNFNCKASIQFGDTKNMVDVLKHFEIDVPKRWKTNLYFDEYQSDLNAADTTKQLTESYIVEISWHQGELIVDKNLEVTIKDLLKNNDKLTTVKSGLAEFKSHPAYYNLSQGQSGNYTYHLLQVYAKTKSDEYFNFKAKIYGDDFIDERVCAALAFFENVKFLK